MFACSNGRKRFHGGPNEREPLPGGKGAMAQALMKFAMTGQGDVFEPTVGTEFDSVTEADDFYNLFSWETGFGIRLGNSHTNHSYDYELPYHLDDTWRNNGQALTPLTSTSSGSYHVEPYVRTQTARVQMKPS